MARTQGRGGVIVQIPPALQALAGGNREARVRGQTVGEALTDLAARYPALRPRLRGEDGQLRRFVLVFVNSEDIRSRQGEETPVREGDRLAIVPAVDGG